MKIAIIDTIGLTYDGDTLSKRGLGGSESAVILMSKELAKIGFDVTVFNNCMDDDCKPGIYDKVKFLPLTILQNTEFEFDIVISSRTIIPFIPPKYFNRFQPDQYGRYHDCQSFKNIKGMKHKILWKHDTFCMGDDILEELVLDGYIDEIFTLSDFHSTYISNSDHGKKRIYEVLKNKIFQTRNGIVNYIPEVDISKKDRNHFVYNASITKGMIPLVNKIWPKIHAQIPDAKLTVIGGYYRFRSTAAPDEQEVMFHNMVKEKEGLNQNITFTGIISQKKIAEILANASFFLFPGVFPETFGISTLESLTYNTPLVATRFGALEETAVDMASYFIDYSIDKTPLSNWIDTDEQVRKFVNVTLDAYNNTYLHQQKMYYCNETKDISTWDTIALQWKQHFFKIFRKHLSLEEYKKVSKINTKVHEVFGRRISNHEEWGSKKQSVEKPIVIISPFFNAENYIKDHILSVSSQDYENYNHYLIDDCSTDKTEAIVKETIESLPKNIQSKIHYIKTEKNQGAVCNQYKATKSFASDANQIVMFLDGDDQLINDNTIFDYYNNLYDDNVEFTYGSCWSMADNIPLVAQPYSKEVRDAKSYRDHKFNWGIPYTHLRTFNSSLFKDITEDSFKDKNGRWFKAGGDNATFYNIIEKAHPDKIKAVPKITVMYNDINPLNDYKVNAEEQTKNANLIRNNNKVKKILIAIPTAKYIEPETFKSIYDLEVPDGYVVDFQYFFGYAVSQIRNLISSWVLNGYDYLFSVDSDIAFPKDTLKKLLQHDVDMVSGVYRQRKTQQILEIYVPNEHGGMVNVPYDLIKDKGLVSIVGCGFGCVLIKREVFEKIPYPQFFYHEALDHNNTVSEDVDFCMKATKSGSKIYCDPTILCDHIGSATYRVK